MKVLTLKAAVGAGFVLLLVNTGYVSAFASATVFYMTNVLRTWCGGGGGGGWPGCSSEPELRGRSLAGGALRDRLGLWVVSRRGRQPARASLGARRAHLPRRRLVALLPFLFRLGRAGAAHASSASETPRCLPPCCPSRPRLRQGQPEPDDRIDNPSVTPASMHEEGGGPKSPFFPSSARTNVGGIIPSNFFMDSEVCGECHKDIYEQWNSSVHHFASFNNQFYRKSIEYMQDVVGTQPSKWCAGCHDHAVFFNGRFERPIKEQIDTPEAHAGLALHVLPLPSCTSTAHGQRRLHDRVSAAPRAA